MKKDEILFYMIADTLFQRQINPSYEGWYSVSIIQRKTELSLVSTYIICKKLYEAKILNKKRDDKIFYQVDEKYVIKIFYEFFTSYHYV